MKVARVIREIVRRGFLDWFVSPRRALRYWRKLTYYAAFMVPPDGADTGAIRTIALADVLSDAPAVSLVDYREAYGDVTLDELVTLMQLAAAAKPSTVFEIGTFEGGTTLQFAANTDAHIVTLDLPPGSAQPVIDAELDVYPTDPGWRVHQSPYASRVEQRFGDSLGFDFAPWYGKVEMVFVDGSHHYEHARSDTEHALLMCPSGLIVWHDYASYAGGVRATLDELSKREPLVHIAGTSLVLRLPNDARGFG